MCCIIHRPKSAKEIDSDNLKKVIDKNPHGWGVAFIGDDGFIKVEKSMDMKLAFDKVRELEKENKEFIFHVRWATHGEKTVENCHPFDITNGVMFHNGKMDCGGWKKSRSDTWHFSFKINKFLGKGLNLDQIIKEKYEKMIGQDRLAFLLEGGFVIKYGDWTEIDGCFYSKLDWKNQYNYYCGGNYYSPYDHYDRVSNTKPQSDTNNSPTGKEIISNSTSKVSPAIKDDISNHMKNGIVLDAHIAMLSVDEIQKLIDEHPDIMAEYLYKLINGV